MTDKTLLLCLCNVTAVAARALHSAAKQIVSRTSGVAIVLLWSGMAVRAFYVAFRRISCLG